VISTWSLVPAPVSVLVRMHQFVVLRILIACHHPGKSHQVVCGQREEVDTSKPGRGWNDGRWVGIWRSGGRRRKGGMLGVGMRGRADRVAVTVGLDRDTVPPGAVPPASSPPLQPGQGAR
jgi:hypothetical protein